MTSTIKTTMASLCGVLGLICYTPIAQAIPLAPGGTTPGGCFAPAGACDFTGQPVGTLDALLVTPVSAPTFTGTLTSAVYQDGAFLDFYYQYNNSSLSADSVDFITPSSFTGFTTDVGSRDDASVTPGLLAGGFLTGVGDANPVSAFRLSNGSGIDFEGIDAMPGHSTYVLVIRTDATTFGIGNAAIQDTTNVTVSALAPTPEPALVGLLFGGLLGIVAVVERRRRTQQV